MSTIQNCLEEFQLTLKSGETKIPNLQAEIPTIGFYSPEWAKKTGRKAKQELQTQLALRKDSDYEFPLHEELRTESESESDE